METKKERAWINNVPLPIPSIFALRGRQSVRATFKLSSTAIEAISIVAAHLGIKQKSIFDHLIEDARSLVRIAREVDTESLQDLKRVQKTFVISRKALISLEEAAQKANASRDALVEMSIQRLLPIISRERQKHAKRKKFLNDIRSFLDKGIELQTKFETDLGSDDPTTVHFKGAIEALAAAQNDISAFVNRGEIIENFDFHEIAPKTLQRNATVDNELNIN